MASVSLNEILGAPQLCGAYETVKSGVPDVFPAGFYTVDQEVNGNTGSYLQYSGQRQTAKLNSYGAASTSVQEKDVTEVPVVLLSTCENLMVPAAKLMNLISKDSAGSTLVIDEKGVKEIMRQVKSAVLRVRNLKTALLGQLLANGSNWFDAAGNLLPTSSGAKTTMTSQIASANLGNLTSVLSGATVWTNTAADIEDQLTYLDQLAIDNTGYDLGYAIYGRNIVKYMTNIPKMAAFLSRNPVTGDSYIRKGIIKELGGLTWLPGYRSSFRDQNDATQRVIGDNQIIFCPEPSTEWLGWINGGQPVPTSFEVAKDAMEAMANWAVQHGDFMYAQALGDPVAIKIVFGTNCLPTVRVPKAVYSVDVTA